VVRVFRKNAYFRAVSKNRKIQKIATFREKRPESFEISGLGGDDRYRTADLLNAILERLYTP
jgi:hypothetical protein